MRNAQRHPLATEFLGVRLTVEEMERLDALREKLGTSSRTATVRALLRTAERPEAERSHLPMGLAGEIEEVVESGWAASPSEALTLGLTLGLKELSRIHERRVPALKQRGRDLAERRNARRQADREGRELLER
ncbi:MAG: ribbon-helix-helix protein, CopG family [Thermoplasmata archaeon]|nr:ribbon-helix-helix protein, CopG family [Thermoplasmata archaeon]